MEMTYQVLCLICKEKYVECPDVRTMNVICEVCSEKPPFKELKIEAIAKQNGFVVRKDVSEAYSRNTN